MPVVQRARIAILCSAFVVVTARDVRADAVQLNFAAVNQSPWTSGNAFVLDRTIRIPDPAFGGNFPLNTISTDPIGALLDFFDIDFGGPRLEVRPAVSFNAGLTAHYHVNGGELDLNYPQEVQLNLPDRIPSGPFSVSASFASPGGSPIWNREFSVPQIASLAGGGFSQFFNSPIMHSAAAFTPTPGFTTTFPFAEARLDLDVKASAALSMEGCFAFFCRNLGDLKLPGVDHHQQLLEVSTLTGVQVLDHPVVQFGEPYNLTGWSQLTVNSPSINVEGNIQADKSLAGAGNGNILDAGFNLERLVPFVGQLLANEYAGIGYELLRFQPSLGLGLYQNFAFTPTLKVELEFSQPVIHNGQATNRVRFGVGDAPLTLTPTTGIYTYDTMSIKPTFVLENRFRNQTGFSLDGRIDVSALQIHSPFNAGPAFSDTIDLFTIQLPPLFDESFSVNIPPITTDTRILPRNLDIPRLSMNLVLDNDDGTSLYDVYYNESLAGSVLGRRLISPILDRPGSFPFEQHVLVTDDYALLDLGEEQYRLEPGVAFCVNFCDDTRNYFPATNPSLTDAIGTLFFSDLSTFPTRPTLADILASDPVLAQSDYFSDTVTSEGSFTPAAPEPASLALFATGVAAAGWRARGAALRRRHRFGQGVAPLGTEHGATT